MKRNMKKSIRIPMIFVLLMVMIFSIAGCEQKKEDSKYLKDLVNNLFTDLSESEYQEFHDAKEDQMDLLADSKEIPQWMNVRFKENMTDEGYNIFVETATYNLPVLGYENKKELKLEDLKVEASVETYDFTGRLIVSSKEDEAKKAEIFVQGSAQLNEEGLVQSINIFNMGEIADEISK